MEWEFQRRLLFMKSKRWTGWFCERCCWNVPTPTDESLAHTVAMTISKDFDAHSCETYAREHWRQPRTSDC